MRKQFFWAIKHHAGALRWVFRFRTRRGRDNFLNATPAGDRDEGVPGTHPEVRRIKRRLAAGEAVTFPVEI
jgi:hypothetical protein